MTCPRCQSENVTQRETLELPHYAREDCADCGRFIKWIPKPDSERIRRPAAHRDLVKNYSRGFCELCLIKEGDLPPGQTLEAQHVEEFQDDGEPTRENIWIVCTKCHKLIHWARAWTTEQKSTVTDGAAATVGG